MSTPATADARPPGRLKADGPRPLLAPALAVRGLTPTAHLVLALLALDTYADSTSCRPGMDNLAAWSAVADHGSLRRSIYQLEDRELVRTYRIRGAPNRYQLTLPPVPEDMAGLIVRATGPRPAVPEVAALPAHWTRTITDRLVLLVAAAASPDGETFAVTRNALAASTGRRVNAVHESMRRLTTATVDRPALVQVFESRGGRSTTVHRLVIHRQNPTGPILSANRSDSVPSNHPANHPPNHPANHPPNHPANRSDSVSLTGPILLVPPLSLTLTLPPGTALDRESTAAMMQVAEGRAQVNGHGLAVLVEGLTVDGVDRAEAVRLVTECLTEPDGRRRNIIKAVDRLRGLIADHPNIGTEVMAA
ncbi:hypothetical protein AB0K08_16840 [Citricoccus sp. NPDC055426]|uniref:hypothetical protein n=1 Tax=Citricoccus sp. NPDC055426 TaxID=3155536 RepID=UPI00343FE545